MKKQQQMFRECPYEVYFENTFCGDCRNCPNYSTCVMMRYRSNQNEKHIAKKKNVFRNRIIAVFFVVALAVTSITAMASNAVDSRPDYPVSNTNMHNGDVVITTLRYDDPKIVVSSSASTEPTTEDVTEPVSEETLPIVIVPEISAYGPGKLYYYDLNESEKLYIAKMVYKEARGESFEGKVAVAAVALNRYFSNDSRFNRRSIYALITQHGQFADISGVSERMLNSVPECMEAVEAACKGWDPTRATFPETGALFFYSPKNMSEEAMLSRIGVKIHVIGNHDFHVDFNPDYAP